MKKNKNIKIFVAILLLIVTVSLACIPTIAAEAPTEADFSGAGSVYMYDITHNVALFDYNSDKVLNTSTSAKIMMGLVLCEALEDRLEETVTVTSKMLDGVKGSCMKPALSVGEQMSVNSLLYAALCGSYNDAAYVLADVAFLERSELVAAMNQKAAELGAKNTKYTNPLGYPDNAEMKTTAEDVLKIATAAHKNELYMRYAAAEKYTCEKTNKSEKRYIYNRNSLVSGSTYSYYYNSNCIGMNAGYSGDDGGWSVVTSVNDEGEEYIIIVLGGKESADETEVYAYEIAGKLADYVCKEYNYVRIYKKDQEVGMTKVGLTALNTDNAPYLAADDLNIYVHSSVDLHKDVIYRVHYTQKNIKAPIEAGTKIGVMQAIYNGQIIGECDLVLEESYERNGIMSFIQLLFDYTQSRAFVASIIFFAISFIITVLYLRVRASKFDRRIRK